MYIISTTVFDLAMYIIINSVNKLELELELLRKIPRNDRYTRPGMYCKNPRITHFQGETYHYQQPEDMQEAICVLLDRFNYLFTHLRTKQRR